MTATLDVHCGSPQEVIAAHRNVHDIWNKGLSVEDHVRYRLDSPSHSRATWYVGTLDGRVVTSLGCYPLRFRARNEEFAGIAIGSVYTISACRGRGFAPQLIAAVESAERQRGAALSILYSDIEPQYYARRGYTLCPSWEGWCRPAGFSASDAAAANLVSVSPLAELPALMEIYAAYHGAAGLSIARDGEYWSAIIKKSPTDTFYAVPGDGANWRGYVRVGAKSGVWRVTDYALADPSEASLEALYRSLLAAAKATGVKRAGGWLPDSLAARRYFEVAPRGSEITMIKPLTPAVQLTPELVAATGRFCEIDHV